MSAALRVCLVASSRFPVAEPFAGGLEAHTHLLARELIARGHEVCMFAAPGSDDSLNVRVLDVETFTPSEVARRDANAMPDAWMREHHAYLGLMLRLGRGEFGPFDVVHNNSLHHLPVALAEFAGCPIVTTLHTPPTPWLESAAAFARGDASFTAVSAHTARQWSHVAEATVVHNGVDLTRWAPGPGGGAAIWFGRLVPEKAPHLAAAAANKAGLALDIVGPLSDPDYFAREVEPLLGGRIRYLGHLRHDALASAIGAASVAVATPEWDEPYGLVVAEALACGTPVAAFDRGAISEIIDESSGCLASPGDVDSLAHAMVAATGLSRADARRRAEDFCSMTRMVDEYEEIYRNSARVAAA
ncbi:MAG: glycosyltransferase [Salinibacterium sp.]|nr:glycosyltransferase [Salinibacterium sp.]MBF0672864.1 glycosyltransferase [Salinibacterium sp.]